MKLPDNESKSLEINQPKIDAEIDVFDPTAISSKGLVCIGNKLLIYRRGPEAPTHPLYLDVPGGRTEPDETPFETWAREVKEEFDLDIERAGVVWARRYELDDKPGKSVYFTVSVLPESAVHNVKLGDEGIEWMLMSPQEFVSKVDVHRPFIDRTVEYLESL